MRLVTFKDQQRPARVGALIDDDTQVVDINKASQSINPSVIGYPSLQAVIEGGDEALSQVKTLVANPPKEALIRSDKITLLAPLPCPQQLRDFSGFEEHTANCMRLAGLGDVDRVWYELPLHYKCNRFSVVGPNAEVEWPKYSSVIDFELEYAAVIGKRGKNISASKAGDYIFGYTIFNDLSARDAQMREYKGMLGPAKGKDFDGGNVLGPCIVTKDEIDNPYALEMLARVNGQVWCRNNSSTIYHTFEDMIAYVSDSETIYPGEVFGSGTVGGGCGLELQRYLQKGDAIELEVDQLGLLRTFIT